MSHEFTIEEIRDSVRTARVHCPGFTEDMFESLMELEKHIADSGYLEVIQGMLRLKEEKQISCTEALDACEKLLKQKAKLERETSDLKKRNDSLVAQIKNANIEYEQTQKAVAKSRQELIRIINEHEATKKELEAFNRKMEKERQRISREVKDSYQESNVTKEEVVTAGQIKAEVESHGYTLDLTLGLAKEFAGYKNAKEKLAEGLKEHGSLYKYLDELHDGATKERERIISEIRGIESQKKALTAESGNLRNILSQLQADVAYEEDLRRFYQRYFRASGLLENLSKWEQVFFMRCGNVANMVAGFFDKRQGNHHFWTDKPAVACPICGYQLLYFDTEIFQYLDWPAEKPFKLILGE